MYKGAAVDGGLPFRTWYFPELYCSSCPRPCPMQCRFLCQFVLSLSLSYFIDCIVSMSQWRCVRCVASLWSSFLLSSTSPSLALLSFSFPHSFGRISRYLLYYLIYLLIYYSNDVTSFDTALALVPNVYLPLSPIPRARLSLLCHHILLI